MTHAAKRCCGCHIVGPGDKSSCSIKKWCWCRSISKGRFISMQKKKALWGNFRMICEFKCIHHNVLFLYRYKTISLCLVYLFIFEMIIHYFKQNPQNQKQQLSRSSSLPARWNLVIPSKPRTGTPKKAAMAESSAQPQKIWWKSLKIGTWGCDSHDVFSAFPLHLRSKSLPFRKKIWSRHFGWR